MSSKSIYSPVFCSCIICHKEYSAKGIHTHFLSSHTESGRERVQINVRKGAHAKAAKLKLIKAESIKIAKIEYLKNPKFCICGKKFSFSTRNNKFCSKSCAAIEINKTRDKICYVKQSNTLKLNLSLQCFYPKKPKIFPTKECKVCRKIFSASRQTCSDECANKLRALGGMKGGKISAAKIVKRSKDEIILFNLLYPLFKRVTHNEPIANGWDADILIYDHKIAILWNGPWHYKEMGHSNHSLKQVRNRDKIKILEFNKIGWKVIAFEDRNYTPESAKIELLNILSEST